MTRPAYDLLSRVAVRVAAQPFGILEGLRDRAALRALIETSVVRDAITRASSSLASEIDVWLAAPDTRPAVEHALVRYVARMAGRATPFGVMAGLGCVEIGAATTLRVAERHVHERASGAYIARACAALVADVRQRVAFRPNATLYRAGGTVRYFESGALVSVAASDYLSAVLDAARLGATLGELAAVLCRDPEVSDDEARTFLDQLVETELLEPAIAAVVTGDAAQRVLHGEAEQLGVALPEITADERSLDQTVHLTGTVGRRVMTEVTRAVQLLRDVGEPASQAGLTEFARRFAARYDAREVPLMQALDEELGVGFSGARGERVTDAARDAARFELVDRAVRQRSISIELTDGDIARLTRGERESADSFTVPFVLAATSREAVEAGTFRIGVLGFDAPAGRLVARMSHADAGIEALVRDIVERERQSSDPDAVFAEIVYLPDAVALDTSHRPVLRPYEIVVRGRSGAPSDRQIALDDLLVSVDDGEVRLRSRALGKQVIARLTCALDETKIVLPVARFLGALARAHGAGLSWSWGPADDAPFTPRVLAGRCVLCRARWRLSAQDVAALRAGDSGVRERWQLPRWIVVRDGDRELPIDLDNAYLREALLGEAATVVREMFPAADELGLDGDDGRFVHELQATYVRRDPVRAARFPTATAAQRSFPPGSEWLYVKWYAGARGVDEILAAIAPVVRELTAAGVSKRWFFVRFADPDWHLRVRLHGEPATLLATVLPALSRAVEPLREAGVIWKTQLDTYERELERYPAIEAAEHVFAADSDAVLAILEAYDDPFDLRRLAMCGVDRLLGDLGLDEAARLALVTRMRDHLGAEQHLGTDGKRRFGELFREREAALVAALTGEDEELALGRSALDGRSAAIAPVIDHLRGPEVAASLAHLHVNRMFAVAPRQQELVVYELMRRTYERLRYTRRSG